MNYNKQVFVLESLNEGEPSDIPIIEGALDGTGFSIVPYRGISSIPEFKAAINQIRSSCPKPTTDMGPFIHISAHGKRGSLCGGIGIATSGGLIRWRTLDSLLSGLYASIQSWAVLYLSACHGLSFRKYNVFTNAKPDADNLAYYGIVSAENPIPFSPSNNESERACRVFYEGISRGEVIKGSAAYDRTIIKRLAAECPYSGFKAQLHPSFVAYLRKRNRQLIEDGVEGIDLLAGIDHRD